MINNIPQHKLKESEELKLEMERFLQGKIVVPAAIIKRKPDEVSLSEVAAATRRRNARREAQPTPKLTPAQAAKEKENHRFNNASRAKARREGLDTYECTPCRKGHRLKFVGNKQCVECEGSKKAQY